MENDAPATMMVAWTTVGSAETAAALAKGAVTARLAACAQVDGPVQSTYGWQGTVETATEWRVTFKTTPARLPELTTWVHTHHPYDTPQWLCTPASSSPAYTQWARDWTG